MLVLLLCLHLAAAELDFCVIGDSTLQMFIRPAWHNFCSRSRKAPCGFDVLQQGIYHKQLFKGKQFDRSTLIGRSSDGACKFMLADYHGPDWGSMLQGFWLRTLGQNITCRRLLTNHHHHANSYLTSKRTLETISTFATQMQTEINATLPFAEFVYLLPTFPANASQFSQTRAGVLELSAVLSTMVETIATLHDLSEIWRARGHYADNMHLDGTVANDEFTMQVVKSILVREFQLCRRHHAANSAPSTSI